MPPSLSDKHGSLLPGNPETHQGNSAKNASTEPNSLTRALCLSLATLAPPSLPAIDRNQLLKELSQPAGKAYAIVENRNSNTLNQDPPINSLIQHKSPARYHFVATQAEEYSGQAINENINKVTKEILSKDDLTTINKVSKCVCLYWLNKDFNEFRNGDQDSDKIPDRVDRDSYHGHGKTRAADHPQPAPGSRADEHYNCEYFATNFWKAFVETVGQDGGKCWIIHYAGHATVAWSYKGEFVIEEPQGGSPYFSKIPALVERNMPDRGQRATVGGAQVYNMPVNHWLAKTGEWNQSIDYNWKPSLWNEAK